MNGVGLTVTAVAVLLLWQTPATFFLLFGGLLAGVLLDALADALRRHTPLSRSWALAVVALTIVMAIAAGLTFGGITIVQQADDMARMAVERLQQLRDALARAGIDAASLGKEGDSPGSLAQSLLPNPSDLFGQAKTAFGAVFGVAGNTLFVILIGLFLAADMRVLRRGALMLVHPQHRWRTAKTVSAGLQTLRWWLVGQVVTMAIIAVSVWLVLLLFGVPGSILLGLQAGLVNFIPYLGPIIAAGPILLAAIPLGTATLAGVMAAFVIIQTLEGYVLTPLIQRRAVDLPPALTLAGIVVSGALFGAAGVALGTPLLAAVVAMVSAWRTSRETEPHEAHRVDVG